MYTAHYPIGIRLVRDKIQYKVEQTNLGQYHANIQTLLVPPDPCITNCSSYQHYQTYLRVRIDMLR